MAVYVHRNGKIIEKHLAGPPDAPRGLHIISDAMEPTRHMADGNYYSSKSRFREATKAAGCVEIGNDAALTRPRKPIPLSREQRRNDIRRTISELRNGGRS